MQAGSWLLAYLLGDRAAVLAELPAANGPASRVSYAVEGMRTSLRPDNDEAHQETPESELENFEQELLALEPLDLAEVKRTLGGEENFVRLERLMAAAKALGLKNMVILEEYEKAKDKKTAEAVATAKLEALEKEFTELHKVDQEALGSYMEKPLIGRYVQSLYQGQATEEQYVRSISVPDLVKLAGRERAEVLLRRALRLRVLLSLEDESGPATGHLARELALAEMANLKIPSWGLAQSVEAGALFEEAHDGVTHFEVLARGDELLAPPRARERHGQDLADGRRRPARHHHDAVGQQERLVHVVGDHDDGLPLGLPERHELVLELHSGQRVQQ